jgi:hypothetical protein
MKFYVSTVFFFVNTDDGLKELLESQTNLEELCLKHLENGFTQTFQSFKSLRLSHVDMSYSPAFNDKGKVALFGENSI